MLVPDPDGEFRLESSHRTDPRVLNPAIMVLGLAAAGNDGKFSSVCRNGGPLRAVDRDDWIELTGPAALRFVEVTVGAEVWPQANCAAVLRLLDLLGPSAGNGSLLVPLVMLLPQEPCRDTADRDDWTVLFFSVNTLRPPEPDPVTPGSVPLGPGKLG